MFSDINYLNQLKILNKFASELNSSINLEQILSTALKNFTNLLSLETGWIFLFDENTGKPYLAYSQNLPSGLKNKPELMDGSCYCLDLYEQDNLNVAENINVISCSRLYKLVEGKDNLKYHASIPLFVNKKKIGVLNLASTEWQELNDSDLQILYTIGDFLGIAIERARLYEKSIEIGAIEERYRLAREIHDTLGQSLAALKLKLETVDALLEFDTDKKKLKEIINDSLQLAGTSLIEARRAVLDLRSTHLEKKSFFEALQELVNNLEQNSIKVEYSVLGENIPISQRICSSLFRIIQEITNNIVKHSSAKKVKLKIINSLKVISILISDNGKGFEADLVKNKKRHGLIGINERVALLNGSFDIQSKKGKGTNIEINIPLGENN